MTRCVGLSHITQLHSGHQNGVLQFSSVLTLGKISGTLVKSSFSTDLHTSGSVKGKSRLQHSKSPSCKSMVLSTTSLSSVVGQKDLGIQGSTFMGLLYRMNHPRGKRFTGQGCGAAVSSLLGYTAFSQTSRSSAT